MLVILIRDVSIIFRDALGLLQRVLEQIWRATLSIRADLTQTPDSFTCVQGQSKLEGYYLHIVLVHYDYNAEINTGGDYMYVLLYISLLEAC